MQITVDEFKERTASKLRDLRCPDHHQPPRLKFQGASLRTINIQMSACCAKLIDLANRRIAER
ncbi:MAG TPA: hypothetical protein VNU44_14350 [Bryobacteraceae bacterium]|nr:hypothetical protein [Bryobacteraceae bacterium]